MPETKKNPFWKWKLPFKKDTTYQNFNRHEIIDTINPLSTVPSSKKNNDNSNTPLSSDNPKIKCIETKLPYVIRRNL